jgi:molybdenum cofactor cytidylyltransferase
MGRPKLALPFAGTTVMEAVVRALRAGGVETVIVVVGPDSDALADLAIAAGAEVLRLPADTPQMRDTIEHGLRWLEEAKRPADHDGWLLLPADHPCVEPELVWALLAARKAHPERSVLVPSFGGRRGHPVWMRWSCVAGIRALPPGVGINVYLREHAAEVLEVPVAAESVLWDLDTPEDYERLRSAAT